MGLSASNTYVQNTINSLTSVVNTTVSNTTQDIQTTCTGFNEFQGTIGSVPTEIDPDGKITLTLCVPPPQISSFTLTQVSQGSCSIQGGLTNDVTQNINNELVNNIDQWLQANAKANNGFLGFGIAIANSEGFSSVDISTRIANALTS